MSALVFRQSAAGANRLLFLLLVVSNGLLCVSCLTPLAAQDAEQKGQATERATERASDVAVQFDTYRQQIATLCLDCHATETREGELDLERFASWQDFRSDLDPWHHAVEQLEQEEMPPADSPQPSAEQRRELVAGLKQLIDAEILSRAGDPGKVVLRRLNNAEYTYTIQDLTHVSLEPAREFPVDSAAGEGFVNSGEALAMSPALLQKYIDAGQQIASHAVLLPDGFRFSPSSTRRDWADEIVARIRNIYAKHTSGISDTRVLDQWSADPTRSTANDGRIHLERYLVSLIRHRSQLAADPGPKSIAAIAQADNLSGVYFSHLVDRLMGSSPQSLLLRNISRRIANAKSESAEAEAADIARTIEQWQEALWTFNTVGQMGMIRPWQIPKESQAEQVVLRRRLPELAGEGIRVRIELTDVLHSPNASERPAGTVVLIDEPRIEFTGSGASGRQPLKLRALRGLQTAVNGLRSDAVQRSELYLLALQQFASNSPSQNNSLDGIAAAQQLDPAILRAWAEFVGLAFAPQDLLRNHLHAPMQNVAGFEALSGWGSNGLPELLANRSSELIRFSTLGVPARSVTVHPTPTQEVLVAWQSPVAGSVELNATIADMDGNCGNGVAWRIERLHRRGTESLAAGAVENGREVKFTSQTAVEVAVGDVIWLAISPRDGDHSCDTTHIELKIATNTTATPANDTNQAVSPAAWSLSGDVAENLLAGNPHDDQLGNKSVWHFLRRDVASSLWQLPRDSSLDRWRAAVLAGDSADAIRELAAAVSTSLLSTSQDATGQDATGQDATSQSLEHLSAPEQQLVAMFRDPHGPMRWIDLGLNTKNSTLNADEFVSGDRFGLPLSRFGNAVDGAVASADSIVLALPATIEFELPSDLVGGAEFVTSVRLLPNESSVTATSPAAVQVALHAGPVANEQVQRDEVQRDDDQRLTPGDPLLTLPASPGRTLIEQAYADFRWLFPAAMCHARIVPVDEVVTLVLYHREDEPLMRLMMTAAEARELDRLWDELRFVSQDPLRLEVALEQLLEFATQDADPGVFKPLLGIIADNGIAYRQELKDAEGVQLEQLVAFAARAYRRDLQAEEAERLRAVYRRLRDEELSHEQAWRWTLARILASPAFLYRLETAPDSTQPGWINDHELANRLSYFLWSSMPDEQLLQLAREKQLNAPEVLLQQLHRMLSDDKSQRMSVEFGLQWMGLRDFSELGEKSESQFPEFAELRDDMAEETARVFQYLIQENRPILELIDADYTFLNEALAKHYGISGIDGPEWRMVNNVRESGRGGVLLNASVLARQSGASRTSPILRGNWLSESILGERLPRPPKDVPILPDSDDVTEELSVRQLVERHASDPACSKCHAKIDPYGFALENYDAIGRYRPVDERGQPFDTQATLPDGFQLSGSQGLREYLLTERRDAFVRQFCRKLLGFALGRAVMLSDQPLLEEIERNLAANEYRFLSAVEPIVLSQQFRMIRGQRSF